MTTTYALHLKLDLLLNDQPQLTYPDGRAAWDFEPERRLIWIDEQRQEHICDTPPVTLPIDYRPRAMCGREVTTTKLKLVDTEEWPLPSCPSCYGAYLRRLHGMTAVIAAERASTRMALRSLWVSIFVATLLLAPSLDDLTPGIEADRHEIAQGPSLDDGDASPNDQDL